MSYLPRRTLNLSLLALLSASLSHTTVSSAKSFFEVLEMPLASHPEVMQGEASMEAQRLGIKSVRGEFLPNVEFTAGYGRERSDSPSTGNKEVDLSREENRIVLTQLLYDGQDVWSRFNRQAARYRAEQTRLSSVQESVLIRAVNVYLDSVKSREIGRLAKSNEQEHIETLDKVKQLFAGGAGRKGDISLAEGRLAQTRATLTRLDNNIKDANATYKSIIGEPLTYKVRWPEVPKAYLPKSLTQAIEIGERNNPALQTAHEEILAAEWDVSSMQSAFWPTLDFEVAATKNKDLDGTRGENNDLSIMLKANWNLFSGGSDMANYHQSQQRKREADESLQRQKRQVIEQVTQAWNKYQMSMQRLEELKKHMIASREVLDAYEEQFKYGQRQLFNVLDQKNELFDSKVNFVNGRDEMIRESYALLQETGTLKSYVMDERNKEKERAAKIKKQELDAKRRQGEKDARARAIREQTARLRALEVGQ